MKIFISLGCVLLVSCKLVNQKSQAKIDDSDTRKTVKQQKQEKTNMGVTR